MGGARKDILIIMPSMVGGGAEKALINLLTLFKEERLNIKMYIGRRKGILLQDLPADVHVEEIFPSHTIEKIAFYLLRWFRIDFLIRWFGRGITGEYSVGMCFLDSIYTEFLNIPQTTITKKVTVLHSSYKSYSNKSKFIKGWYKKRMKSRYEKMDQIIAVSHAVKDEFLEIFGTSFNVDVIYNPFHKTKLLKSASMPPTYIKNDSGLVLVAIGSLIPVKGYDLLIDTLDKLKDYNFKAYILGSGYMKEELQERIRVLNLTEKIILCGFDSNPYKELINADLFVMSSVSEGLPTVLCEALILGVPVMVPNVTGCREVIDNGKFGLLYERNLPEFVSLLQSVLKDPSKLHRYQELSKQRAMIFDDTIALKKYKKVLDISTN